MTKNLAAFALVVVGMAVPVRPVAAQATGSDPAFQAQAATAAPTPASVATPVQSGSGEGAPNAVARFGPTIEGAKLLAPARTQQEQRRLGHEPAYRRGEPGVALMIVGGALFLGGAIVGDRAGDALMVGGVVVAAVGLYQYLQ